MEGVTSILDFYAGRTIFITGGTGFMGKVLIEKMLRCLPKLEKIYVLTRSKRGQIPIERINKMFQLPLFDRLRKEDPSAMKKVVPMGGDLTLDNLGLSHDDLQQVIKEVSVVIHGGATLRLESNVKDAVMQNTVGTKTMLEIALKMKKLVAFLHLSTAFCHVDIDILEEKTYPPLKDPAEIMNLVRKTDYKTLEKMEKSLMAPHPNSYTFSKRLAETVVEEYHQRLPVMILRPSIVIPTLREPMPGWVDSLNGPVGIMAASGKGVLRTMLCDGTNHAEVVPCDVAINAIIISGKYLGETEEPLDEIPVRNVSTSKDVVNITWGEILELGRGIVDDYPFEWTIWYPGGNIHTNVLYHNILVFLFHKIPAYFIDFLLLIFMQKRFMVRVQEKISVGLEVLQYFTMRKWDFKNTKTLGLYKYLTPEDFRVFYLHNVTYDIREYFIFTLLGTRHYCLKENPDSIAFWRKVVKVLYVIDRGLKLYLLYKLVTFGFYLFGASHLLTLAYWAGSV